MTPKELDHLFERRIITKGDYEEFWSGYWKHRGHKQHYVDRYVNEMAEQNIRGSLPVPKVGTVTEILDTARLQAKLIGGFVVRRDSRGRFATKEKGVKFQAVRRRKK